MVEKKYPREVIQARDQLAKQHGPFFDFREDMYLVLGFSAEARLESKGLDPQSWQCLTVKLRKGRRVPGTRTLSYPDRFYFKVDKSEAKRFGLSKKPPSALDWADLTETVPDSSECTIWKACRAAAFAEHARMTVDPAEIKAVDAYGRNLLRWFAVDRFQSAAGKTRGKKGPGEKRKKYAARNARELKWWEGQRDKGLQAMKSERAAGADATKELAQKLKKTVSQVNAILRDARRAHLAS